MASGWAQQLQQSFSFAIGGIIERGLTNIAAGIQNIGKSMVGGNAEFERYQTQFGVLLGNADLAQQRLAELAEFGQRTPFELPELVRADKILQSFGLQAPAITEHFKQMGIDIKTISGDLAAGTGASFEEIATNIGRFSAGATGEALQRFAELGIVTRSELAAMGVEFSKSGELVSPLGEAMDVLLQIAQQKFGGMMDAQSQTFEGMLSNLWDWVGQTQRALGEPIFDALKTGLEGLLGLLQPGSPVNQAVAEFAETIRRAIELAGALIQSLVGGGLGGAIESWATSITEKLGQVNDFLRQLKDEFMGLSAGDIMGELGPGLAAINEKMNASLADLAKRHEQTIAGLQGQLANAGEKLAGDLSAINEKYADKISDLQERATDTAAQFSERLSDLAEQNTKKQADLQKRSAKVQSDIEEKLTDLKKDHARRRQELTTSLLTAETEEQYLSVQAQIAAENEKYNEQVGKTRQAGSEQLSEIRSQMAEQDAEYSKQSARLAQQRDKALADIQEQLSEVQSAKAKEVAEVQKAYNEQVAALNAKIAAENEAYAQQQADIKAMYAEQAAAFQAETEARAAAVGSGPAFELMEQIRGAIEIWNQFKAKVSEVWDSLQPIFTAFKEGGFWAGMGTIAQWVTDRLNEVSLAVTNWVNNPTTIETMRTWGRNAGTALIDGITSLLRGEDTIVNIGTALADAWVAINTLPIELAARFVEGLFGGFTSEESKTKLKDGIAQALADASDRAAEVLTEWSNKIAKFLSESASEWGKMLTDYDWSSIGSNIVGGIKAGLEAKWGELTAWLSEKAASLPDWLNNPLGANSPAKKLMPTGASIVQGVQAGAEGQMGNLRKSLGQAMESLIPATPTTGSLAGLSTNYISLTQTNHMPTAPNGFDRKGLMDEVNQNTLRLFAKVYKGEG